MRIEGLETLDYLDNLCQRERFTEQGDAITFESEVKIFHVQVLQLQFEPCFSISLDIHPNENLAFAVCILCCRVFHFPVMDLLPSHLQIDRVYLSSPKCVAVLDHERKRTYVIRKEGLPDIGIHPLYFSLNAKHLVCGLKPELSFT